MYCMTISVNWGSFVRVSLEPEAPIFGDYIRASGFAGQIRGPKHQRHKDPRFWFQVILVGSVLWAAIWYMAYSWYVLGSILRAHSMDCRNVRAFWFQGPISGGYQARGMSSSRTSHW